MLCYEPNTEFCHRHIVAEWFEILLGKNISEVKIKDYQIEEIERPGYIKQYLEDAMRLNKDMQRFRDLYLFEKSEKKLEEKLVNVIINTYNFFWRIK